jgi:1-acyl-sn-glycerol-3-phosphate acyltransferase
MKRKEGKNITFWSSVLLSVLGWVLLGVATFLLTSFALVVLWPISFVFDRASGYLPHRVSQFWASLIAWAVPVWEIRTTGLEQIDRGKPYVIVSNHQSLLDILLVLAKLPLHFKFIGKKELYSIPWFGWHLAAAGYIALKRGNHASGRACLEKARQWLRRGVSVILFPEGTRSLDGEIHEFKPGAFKLALEEKVDLLPVAIYGTREAIPKYSWRIQGRASLNLHVLKPVSLGNRSLRELLEIRDQVRKSIVTEFTAMKAKKGAPRLA